jgi:lipopolysaccharide transport system ATP-binding protein
VCDAEFQKKAIGKMQDISRTGGRTVLFVSHNMAAVKQLCTRGIVLDKGFSVFSGNTNEAIDFYINQHNQLTYLNPVSKELKEYSNGPKILQCDLKDVNGLNKSFFSAGEIISFNLAVQPDPQEIRKYSVVWFIYNSFDEEFAICSSGKMNSKYYDPETTKIICDIESSGLLAGDYSIRFVLHVSGDDNFDDWKPAINFNIISHDINETGFEYPSIWSPQTFLKSKWY